MDLPKSHEDCPLLAMTQTPGVTQLLRQWRSGDEAALDKLTPVVYDELKRLARGIFKSERADHTLQPTALVNEAFLGLVGTDVGWQDRAHFFALAARMMRRILVNHANAKKAAKRGDGQKAFALDEELVIGTTSDQQVIALNDCLEALQSIDERKAHILELHYFGGLTYKEMAETLNLSTSTLDREIRFARAWLQKELQNIDD